MRSALPVHLPPACLRPGRLGQARRAQRTLSRQFGRCTGASCPWPTRCGTSSTKKMSQHSFVNGAVFCAPSRIIRDECASTRIESGDALSIAPHDVPLVPVGRKRLSPFSTRSQSCRVIVACTGASDVFESEKLADTRLLPAVIMVTSSGSTSSCADARCETTTPTAQRASTVARACAWRSTGPDNRSRPNPQERPVSIFGVTPK